MCPAPDQLNAPAGPCHPGRSRHGAAAGLARLLITGLLLMSVGAGHARTLSVLVLSPLSEQLDRPVMAALTRELAPLERQGHHLVLERGELDPQASDAHTLQIGRAHV